MTFIDPFKPIVLSHPRLPLTAHVIPLGLNVTRLIFENPNTGEKNDVITGPEDARDHWTKGRTFQGSLVGRYANRLPSGPCKFEGGEMNVPEFSAPGVCLHGGAEVNKELAEIPEGVVVEQEGPLDRIVWSKIPSSRSALFGLESPSCPPSSAAIFAVISAADSNGFPGAIRIEARLAIQMPDGNLGRSNPIVGRSTGIFRIEYRAQIIDNCEATPFNITQHWGFNLSASDKEARKVEKGTTDEHLLRMIPIEGGPDLYTLGLDDQLVPTGSLIKCNDGKEHDWTQPGDKGLGRAIKEAMSEKGYDHFYAWGRPAEWTSQRQVYQQDRVILHSPATRMTLAFRTNQSGTQFYNAIGQPDAPAPPESSGGAKKHLHEDDLASPSGVPKRGAVFLEFAHPHGTFLHEKYQELAKDDTILRRMQVYYNWVEVELYKGL